LNELSLSFAKILNTRAILKRLFLPPRQSNRSAKSKFSTGAIHFYCTVKPKRILFDKNMFMNKLGANAQDQIVGKVG
jgi:hypothetical protein